MGVSVRPMIAVIRGMPSLEAFTRSKLGDKLRYVVEYANQRYDIEADYVTALKQDGPITLTEGNYRPVLPRGCKITPEHPFQGGACQIELNFTSGTGTFSTTVRDEDRTTHKTGQRFQPQPW